MPYHCVSRSKCGSRFSRPLPKPSFLGLRMSPFAVPFNRFGAVPFVLAKKLASHKTLIPFGFGSTSPHNSHSVSCRTQVL